jgi:hypothetical protein
MKNAATTVVGEGDLDAWQTMIRTFELLQVNGEIQPGIFDDFEEWLKWIKEVEPSEIALRETRNSAIFYIVRSLTAVGLNPSDRADAPLAAAPPLPLVQRKVLETLNGFAYALGTIDTYIRDFAGGTVPPELIQLKGILQYNRAALKMAHLIEWGEMARQGGSGLIAELYVRPNSVFQDPQSMYEDFCRSIRRELDSPNGEPGALQLFEAAQLTYPRTARGWSALTVQTIALFNEYLGHEDLEASAKVDQMMADLRDQKVLQMLRAARQSPYPLLIVKVPPIDRNWMQEHIRR